MKIPDSLLVKQISTLNIYAYKGTLSKDQYYYLQALDYLFQSFESIKKDSNTFCLYIGNNSFLIANHMDSKMTNPFVFINNKREILFDVDITIFNNAIKEFKQYVEYQDRSVNRKDLPYEKKIQLAIKDYKNDKLDFYSGSQIVADVFINQARQMWEERDL